jgi:hypothetical protein
MNRKNTTQLGLALMLLAVGAAILFPSEMFSVVWWLIVGYLFAGWFIVGIEWSLRR